MVSSIDPTWDSIAALLRWKPETEFLEVKEGKTNTGSKVKYVGVREKPGFLGRLAEKIRNLFGGGSWSLDRVVQTLDVVIGEATKLSTEQTEAIKKLLPKIADFDKKHKGKISETVIARFNKLASAEESTPQEGLPSPTSKSAAPVLTDIRKGRAHPTHRPPTKGKMPSVPEPPPSAVPSSLPPEPSSKKPVGAAGLGPLPGLEEAIRRRQAKLEKPPEQKT